MTFTAFLLIISSATLHASWNLLAKKSKATALCAVLAIFLSCCFKYIPVLSVVPAGFTVIICAVAASAIFAYVSPVVAECEEADANE